MSKSEGKEIVGRVILIILYLYSINRIIHVGPHSFELITSELITRNFR